MANYQLLKADIDAKVYQNGHQEITGENLNYVLNQMVTTLGEGYQFAGVATTATNPGTPDAKVFYIANGKGTYTNFGGIEVTEDDVVVLYWDTAWHKEATGIASQAKLTELEGQLGAFKGNGSRGASYPLEIEKGDTIHIAFEASPNVGIRLYNGEEIVDDYLVATGGTSFSTSFVLTSNVTKFQVVYGDVENINIYSSKPYNNETFDVIASEIDSIKKNMSSINGTFVRGAVIFNAEVFKAGDRIKYSIHSGSGKLQFRNSSQNMIWMSEENEGIVTIPNGFADAIAALGDINISIWNVTSNELLYESIKDNLEDASINLPNNTSGEGYYWSLTNGKVSIVRSGSYPTIVGKMPYPIKEGQVFAISSQLPQGSVANYCILSDDEDNMVSLVSAFDDITRKVVIPSGCTKLYINADSTKAFSLFKYSDVNTKIRMPIELPIYAPSPQLNANDNIDSDINAETATSEIIHSAIEGIIDGMPRLGDQSYSADEILPKYANVYEKVVKDASGLYDIKAYVLTRRNRFAWKAQDKLYAWKPDSGDTIVYTDNICPRVGDNVYSDANKTILTSVANYRCVSQGIDCTNNKAYNRIADNNIEADIIYSTVVFKQGVNSITVIDKNSQFLGNGTKVTASSLTYNGKTYTRTESFDFHTDNKATIVLWANEHGAHSDPHDASIVLYRMIKDMSVGCRNNQFLSFLKNYCKIVFIPCANPYGMNKFVSENREGRTNYHNVNINRNYDTIGWYYISDTDKGTHAGSEPETQFIMTTTDVFNADIAIDIHCLSYDLTGNSDGLCHYEGRVTSLNKNVKNTMELYGLNYTSYGDAKPDTSATGADWIYKMGISGGLIEMNAGFHNNGGYNGKQHTSHFMEANYSLLLNTIRMWYYGHDDSLDLNNTGICRVTR